MSCKNKIFDIHLLHGEQVNHKEPLRLLLYFIRDMYQDDCIVINFVGGPGVGKSIITAETFAKLKRKFMAAEISPEYIKKNLREKSLKAVENQIYIFGKQQYQLYSNKDDVDVVITDSPLIFSSIYDSTNCPFLKGLILKEFNKYTNVVYYIERDESVAYEQEGRYQNEKGAKKVDTRVIDFMNENGIEYTVLKGIGEDSLTQVVSETIIRYHKGYKGYKGRMNKN